MADTRVLDDPNIPKPKKSTFKITSVTKPRGGSGELQADDDGGVDSMDDLDESHTEDFSSEIHDSSKATDIDQESALTPECPEEIFIKDNRPADAQSRFRVVKIETKEPFRRGRWFCHDFLDTQPPAEKAEVKHNDEINVHSGTSSANNSIHYVHGVDDPSRNPLLAGAVGTVHHSDGRPGNFSPKPGETFKPIHPAPQASQAPVMPVTAIPPQRQTSGVDPSMVQGQNPNIHGSQQLPSSVPQGNPQMQQPVHIPVPSHPNLQQVPQAQTSTAPSIPQTIMATNVQPPLHIHQNIGQGVNVHGQTGNMSTGQVAGMQIPANHIGPGGHGVMPNQSIDPHSSQTQNFPPMKSVPVDQMTHPQGQVGPGTKIQQVTPNPMAPSHYGQVNQPGSHSINPSATQQQSLPNHIPNADSPMDAVQHSQAPEGGVQSTLSSMTHGQDSNTTSRPGSIPLTNDDSNTDVTREPGEVSSSQTLLSPLAAAVGSMTTQPADEVKDDSGSSTVAIDNKIEQAMDLVKSHLMFAVREEVEVLKEQIKDLMEKIGQLEHENSVLKAHATQETLSQLKLPKQQPPSSSS